MRIVVAVLIAGLVGLAPPAGAATHEHFGESARTVAREIACKGFRRTGGGNLTHDGGICRLKGKRVNVLTFVDAAQQTQWNKTARDVLPTRFYWADGEGAVVVAKNGNRAAARIGARRLPGTVEHG